MKFMYTTGSRPLDGYTIKRGVGHGGFGEVYYAVSDGGKEVALKLVQRNLDVELRGVAQCMNLKHPNLVTLYDLRTSEAGEHWVVMEFVSGKSLADLLAEQPEGFSLDEVNRWISGICSGIGYLHDKGIVHRDLKPANLFMEDGVVKVGDYGLSKFITASRRSGQTESVGTVHYMAPEISHGKYDREVDVYATGIMLYEMITGHVPFDGQSVGEILMKHLTAQPDVSRLPQPYAGIVTRALAKDPAARFSTMEQLLASLQGQVAAGFDPARLRETAPYLPPPDEAAAAGANSAPAPGAAAPHAGPRTGWDRTSDWIGNVRTKAVAWYERPWGPLDYLLGVVAVLALASLGSLALAGMAPLLPGAALAGGIALLVLKLSRKKGAGAVVAGPVTRPVILTPFPAAPPPPPPVRIVPAAPPAPSAPVVRMQPARHVEPRQIPPRPARTRLAETTSAMLLTTVLAVIGSVLAAGLMGMARIEECALLAAATLAGCWAVLIPGKIWEGHQGDVLLRRLLMAATGVGVGLWCSYLDGVLQVGWLNNPADRPLLFRSMEWMPRLLADAGYFGLVFMGPRWWTLADARRPLRFNPWMVLVPSGWAWLIAVLWSQQFESPDFWGVVVTGMVATLVQLAAPWENPAARRRVA